MHSTHNEGKSVAVERFNKKQNLHVCEFII